jgi:hypothetical protein
MSKLQSIIIIKILDGLLPATVNAKTQQKFDAFVEKLTAVGVDVTVVDDSLDIDTPDSIFRTIGFHFMKMAMCLIPNVC